jgi:hypothetical protein
MPGSPHWWTNSEDPLYLQLRTLISYRFRAPRRRVPVIRKPFAPLFPTTIVLSAPPACMDHAP